MNEDGRGFSPCVNQVATAEPLDEIRVRGRRARFFSGNGGRALAAIFGGGGGGFTGAFGFATMRAAGFGGLMAFLLGGGGAFLAGRRAAALGRAGRRNAFLAGRLGARAAFFFPCTLAIVPKNGAQYSGRTRLTPAGQPISSCRVSRRFSAIFLIFASSRPSTITLTLFSVPE